MKRQIGNSLVVVSISLLVLSVAVKAQSASDLEVSDLRFVYDVNKNFELRASPDEQLSPAMSVMGSPIQQVSALFSNTGTKSIRAVT